jgi:hypothetical protein
MISRDRSMTGGGRLSTAVATTTAGTTAAAAGPSKRRRNVALSSLSQDNTRKKECDCTELFRGRIVVKGLTVLAMIAILVNVVFFATLQDHPNQPLRTRQTIQTNDAASPKSDPTQQISDSERSNNRILATFQEAGITLTKEELAALPTWDDVEQVVGKDAPLIYNLEKSCAKYRSLIPGVERNIGCSGMFNSGTNLVTQLLKENCVIPERVAQYGMDGPFRDKQGKPIGPGEAHGMRWQVPWGKHMPANYREEHATKWATQIWKESVLAVVTIRHPYAWFASMCKNHYSAYWVHNERGLCPHLLNKNRELVPVEVKYDSHKTHYDSLAHLWNDWYAQYLTKADFPYIVVRFEDLQFHAKNVTYQICECAGGEIRTDRPFSYIVDSAKDGPGHGKTEERTGMLAAWKKYGKPLPPQNGFSTADYETAVKYLDADYMKMFGYHHPDPIREG